MKKIIFLILCGLLGKVALQAQSISTVLQHIEQNNKTLQAAARQTEALKLEAHTGKYLPNPTVELNQLWADRSVGGNVNELAVVQTFDFPSVYANKNKLAKLQSETYDFQYATTRQQILLVAQQTCLEIIYLRQQKKLLENRLQNAQLLTNLYEERLKKGGATQLELNKIQLEKINAQNAARLNETALRAKLEQLQTLNGGLSIVFTDENYPELSVLPAFEELETSYLAADPNLKSLTGASAAANREIKLSRAQTLPKFDLGYRRNGGSEEKLNGFRIGMSIPLWENKNTVKKARAQAEYATINLEDNRNALKTTLRELYLQAQALQNSCNEYAQALTGQRNEELLTKALQTGFISMIDYFVEITILYDSMQNYLDVRKEYHSVVAQLLQYKL